MYNGWFSKKYELNHIAICASNRKTLTGLNSGGFGIVFDGGAEAFASLAHASSIDSLFHNIVVGGKGGDESQL